MKLTALSFGILLACTVLTPSCSNKKQEAAVTVEEQVISPEDSLLNADKNAITGLLKQKVDGMSICGISLRTKTSDIKTILKLRPKVTGSTHPRIAYGRFNNNRMTWGLSIAMDKPFGTQPTATPRQVTMEISLPELAAKNKTAIAQHVAGFFHLQPETWKELQGYWMIVSVQANNIVITIADTKNNPTEQKKEDENTFDFS